MLPALYRVALCVSPTLSWSPPSGGITSGNPLSLSHPFPGLLEVFLPAVSLSSLPELALSLTMAKHFFSSVPSRRGAACLSFLQCLAGACCPSVSTLQKLRRRTQAAFSTPFWASETLSLSLSLHLLTQLLSQFPPELALSLTIGSSHTELDLLEASSAFSNLFPPCT